MKTNLVKYIALLTTMLLLLSGYSSLAAQEEVLNRAPSSTFVVNSSNNVTDGFCNALHCSLAEAINAANNDLDHSTINFFFDAPVTIKPTKGFEITTPVTIDGVSGNSSLCPTEFAPGDFNVTISGENIAEDAWYKSGFAFRYEYVRDDSFLWVGYALHTAVGSQILGLNITNFPGSGIVDEVGGIDIFCNHIGVTNDGTGAGNGIGIRLNIPYVDNTGLTRSTNSTIGVDHLGYFGRNIISANLSAGIEINSDDNTVQQNYIGTDFDGDSSLPNGGSGIVIFGDGNTIGGVGADEGNLISGNNKNGVYISGNSNDLFGNTIGKKASNDTPLPNLLSGLIIFGNSNQIGGASESSANLISGNGRHGIHFNSDSAIGASGGLMQFQASNNRVSKNYIGSSSGGFFSVPNERSGIRIDGGVDNLIGLSTIEAPTIAYNTLLGVVVSDTEDEDGYYYRAGGNRIRFGRIHSNGDMGINLVGFTGPVTPNDFGDADVGPNGLQNFPELDAAVTTGLLSGSLNSNSGDYTIDVYQSFECDGSGHGEGETLLTSFDVTVGPIGSSVDFSETLSPVPTEGDFISLTATDSDNNTSEFSACKQVTSPSSTFTVDTLLNGGDVVPGDGSCAASDGSCTLEAAIDEVNASPVGTAPKHIEFAVSGLIQPFGAALDTIIKPVVINAIIGNGSAACPTGYDAGNLEVRLDGINVSSGTQHGLTFGAGSEGSRVRGLSITRFPNDGIRIETDDITVTCNFIGVRLTGSGVSGNGGNGITIDGNDSVIGGAGATQRNVVSNNAAEGIAIIGLGLDNTVSGNIIGFDATGMTDYGNGLSGISVRGANSIIGGSSEGEGNLIGNHDVAGVHIFGTGSDDNTVSGNLIGVRADGVAHDDAASTTLIYVDGADNNEVGGNAEAAGNLLGRSSGLGGVWLNNADGTKVRHNSFGRNIDGSSAASLGYGVWVVDSDNGTISNNTIANFQFDGVAIDANSTGNAVGVNSIYDNGDLGIDLELNGVSGYDGPGDIDTGANNLQNWPGLMAAFDTGRITGLFESAGGNTYRFDIYESDDCDPSGYGEGQRYLGRYDYALGANADSFDFILDTPPELGKWVTMTATDPSGNTSEFSQCKQVQDVDYVVNSLADDNLCDASECTLRGALTQANLEPVGPVDIRFDVQGTIMPATVLPMITQLVTIDAQIGNGAAVCPTMLPNGSIQLNQLEVVLDASNVNHGLRFGAGSSDSSVRGLAIVNALQDGIRSLAAANSLTISCNYFGTMNPAGTGFVAAGNGSNGVELSGSSHVIGTSVEPNIFRHNGEAGVNLPGNSNRVERNAIESNLGGGILLSGLGSTVISNTVLSNTGSGIDLDSAEFSTIQANVIISNTVHGILLTEANETLVDGNQIGGNGNNGMLINGDSEQVVISNNEIGVTSYGALSIGGNGVHGIYFNDASGGNQVLENVIAGNGFNGIGLDNSTGSNRLSANLIYDNAQLGIDLGNVGVTDNDTDDVDNGANLLQNFPVITEITGADKLKFDLATQSGDHRIEFFSNDSCIADEHGQGETYLGFMIVTAGSDHEFTLPTAPGGTTFDNFSATATEVSTGNTSEFSLCKTRGIATAVTLGEWLAVSSRAWVGQWTLIGALLVLIWLTGRHLKIRQS